MADTFELPRRAMAIFAHPDDVDFGCSGTIALWTAKGVHVTYCLITSGNKGTHDPKMTPERIAAIREQEQQEAGRRAGASEFVFLRHDDGETEVSMDLRGEVCEQIRIHKPDLVFCPDPWREYQMHPDHRVAGWAALDGVIAARDHLFFPEQLTNGLTHHRVSRALLFGTGEPNVWFDITTTMTTKIHALQAHESQIKDFKGLAERMHAFAGATGKAWGLEKAEAFRYVELA
jgi:LmbE family N-acetylglucosaminyl deacetylase